jgi:hypothetical protein
MHSDHFYFRRLRLCLAGTFLFGFNAAQLAVAQQPNTATATENLKPDSVTCSLTGTVVNSLTGEPVRRAAVNISGQADQVTLTDNSGHFEFNGLLASRVFVSVVKPGFFAENSNKFGFTALDLTKDAPPVVLTLVPAGVIWGRLTNQNEQPLEGFQLHVISRTKQGGRAMWFGNQFQARSDENGNFRISGLPAGAYLLVVDQSQETSLSQTRVANAREQTYARVFYPGVSELGASTPLDIQPGQQLEANFAITAEAVYQVSGIAAASGNLNLQLIFTRRAGDGFDFTQTAQTQDGRFQAKLPAGSYSVSSSTDKGVSLSSPGASVVIGSDSPDVHVVLLPAPSIEVLLRTEGTGAAPPQNLTGGRGIPTVNVQLTGNTMNSYFGRPTKWWNPPLPEIQNVEPGTYSVEVNSGGPWWVKSIRAGGIDLLSDDLSVSPGIQPPPIELILRDDASTVTGTVVAAEPTIPPFVLLVQPHGRRNLIKVTPAVEGKFAFDGVAPGDYLLLAFDQANQIDFEDPEILSPYLSKAAHLSVTPHGNASISLNLLSVSK